MRWNQSKFRPIRLILAFTVFGLLGSMVTATSTSAATATDEFNILVLGDSFSAGNGAGRYVEPDGCYRSPTRNYGGVLASLLASENPNVRVKSRTEACSGAVAAHISSHSALHDVPAQIDAISSSDDLILLTIGGNDAGFGGVVTNCLATPTRHAPNCDGSLDYAEHMLYSGNLKRNVVYALNAIDREAPSIAGIGLLGYPQLEGAPKFAIRDGDDGEWVEVGKRLRKLQVRANQLQQDIVSQFNRPSRFHFISVQETWNAPPFRGLYADGRGAPDSWLVKVGSTISKDTYYHPTPTGWAENAKLLMSSPWVGEVFDRRNTTSTADWSTISTGGIESCGIRAGALFCWGNNDFGQLGTGDTTYRNTPTRVGTATNWSTISTGSSSCGIRVGALYCWGIDVGRLGTGDNSVHRPTRVGTATNWTSISVGNESICGTRTGELYCWGDNYFGQLGTGDTTTRNTPTRVGTATNWTISVGDDDSSCGTRAGELYCWGNNNYGQLGTGDTTNRNTPTRVGTATNWSAISQGGESSCGTRAGALYCWGWNDYGQLGTGDTTNRNTPTRVGTATNWSTISTGDSASCGTRTGELYCWGFNQYGQLGTGATTDRNRPTRVGTATNWSSTISTDYFSSCGIRAGALYCWGLNDYGQLGLGDNTDRYNPTRI